MSSRYYIEFFLRWRYERQDISALMILNIQFPGFSELSSSESPNFPLLQPTKGSHYRHFPYHLPTINSTFKLITQHSHYQFLTPGLSPWKSNKFYLGIKSGNPPKGIEQLEDETFHERSESFTEEIGTWKLKDCLRRRLFFTTKEHLPRNISLRVYGSGYRNSDTSFNNYDCEGDQQWNGSLRICSSEIYILISMLHLRDDRQR